MLWPRRPHGSQTMAGVGEQISDRVMEPSRDMAVTLSEEERRWRRKCEARTISFG